jgi:hypothetical protein
MLASWILLNMIKVLERTKGSYPQLAKARIPIDVLVLELITENCYCFSKTSLFPKPPPNLKPF